MSNRESATPEGRAATRPSQLRLADWKAVLLRVFDNLGYHNIYLVAAGTGFFGIFAIFPALAALIGIYGLVSDPEAIMDQMRLLGRFLPEDAYRLLAEQVAEILSADRQALSLASLVATGLALWSARTGVGALIDGVNITYSERNERGFFAWYLVSFLMTLVFVAVVLCAVVAIVIVPAALQTMRLGTQAEWVVSMIRWPVVIAAVMLGLGILYRYGPQRSEARLPWITWGSVAATALWLLGSVAFSWYVSRFGDFNATYGSLGAIVGLMLWFYVGSYAILLGAELNAEMEHQTARDTTTGPEKPLGRRGAYVADHVPGLSPERDEAYRDVETAGDAPDDPQGAARPKNEGEPARPV